MRLVLYVTNFRVGDVLMSINDASLEGTTLEDVQAMIKNCPRGDVRVVAQAAPKQSIQNEADKETVSSSSLKEHGKLEEEKHSQSKAEENTLHVLDAERTFKPILLPQERPDDFITIKDGDILVEDSGLENTDYDDLPPPILPPPVPTNDWQMGSFSVIVDEPLMQDTVDDVSFSPPTNFEDVFDDHTNASPSFHDSEEDGLKQTADAVQVDSHTIVHSAVQKRVESLNKTNESCNSVDDLRIPSEDSQLQVSIKPPSLFGDDTESIPSTLPRTAKMTSTVEDATSLESVQWNGVDNAPIKPPSLFDDELESLPSLPQAPPPPKPPRLNRQFVSLDAVSSNSSSPIPSSWFDRESPNHASKYSNLSAVSGSSTPSYGNTSASGVAVPFNDAPIETSDVPDDDMSSLPPAPPPPRSRSSTWTVSSDAVVSSQHGNDQLPHITSPLSQPLKQERTNSKKRILPLRIRSKRGRKTSDQSESSILADVQHKTSPQSSPIGFGDVSISSDLNQPSEDDMESLPPAPPPPRMSPLTVETLESIADGLQPMNVLHSKHRPSRLASDEQRASTPTGVESLHSTQHSPKKKKSFRRNVIHMDERATVPESPNSPTNFPAVSETDLTVNSSLTRLSPLEEGVTVTDSSDAMSPPPLPPEMELWSEAGSVEAELALLDQILTLEDSSRSGNDQSSDAGSSSSAKRLSSSKDLPSVDGKSTEIQEGPAAYKSEETFDQRDLNVAQEGFLDTKADTSFLQGLPDIEKGATTEVEASKPNSSFNMTSRNEEFGTDSAVNDFQEATTSGLAHQELSGKLLKQLSEGHDVTGNLVKHRRPAPPVPTRPTVTNDKASTIPRKSLPGGLGIQVLPSRPDIKPKAAPKHLPTHKHQKEQHKTSSPVKEKTSKKLFSKGHKNKDKRADPNHLESPDTSFESNPNGRERSRSWTKKLFGFRSRSKSRDKSKDPENRSRSISPPRGLFIKSRRSSPPPPQHSPKQAPLSKHKNESEEGLVIDKTEKVLPVQDITKRPVLLPTVPSTLEMSHPPFDEGHYVEGNNNELASPTTDDEKFLSIVERNALNDEPNTEHVVSTAQVVSDHEEPESQNVYLDHDEEELLENDDKRNDLSLEHDDVERPDAHFEVVASLINRPPRASHEKHPDPVALARNVDVMGQAADEERMPKTSPSKPPVPKKPAFLQLGSTPQQEKTVDELKNRFNQASSYDGRLETETVSGSKENLQFGSESDEEVVFDDDDDGLPSPGPPTFKPLPPPLTLRTSSITDDSDKTADSPNSPGPPQFKPLPPPIPLNSILVQNDITSDKRLDPPSSPGPPRFKPAPPPIDLQIRSKNTHSEEEDLPSTANLPNAKPLPPIPSAYVMQRREEEILVKRNIVEDNHVENDTISVPKNERRTTKPLPSIPTGFNLMSNSQKLPLSRQNAHECDNDEDAVKPELLEQKSELGHVLIGSTEDNTYSEISKVVEPLIVQNAVDPVNASNSDDFDSSEVSSEWDDTCSSTQGDPGLSVASNKFARSASFSVGDAHIQRPPVAAGNQNKRVPDGIKRPPPPMRRRSSSLPHLFPELAAGVASEGRTGETDYWHTGNLQQLINSRNQEPDVDEGVIEVQVSPTNPE